MPDKMKTDVVVRKSRTKLMTVNRKIREYRVEISNTANVNPNLRKVLKTHVKSLNSHIKT